jgi:hypothetical protein
VEFESVPTRWRSADVLPFVRGPVSMSLMIWAFEACPRAERRRDKAVTAATMTKRLCSVTRVNRPLFSSHFIRHAAGCTSTLSSSAAAPVRPCAPTSADRRTVECVGRPRRLIRGIHAADGLPHMPLRPDYSRCCRRASQGGLLCRPCSVSLYPAASRPSRGLLRADPAHSGQRKRDHDAI